MTRTASFSGWLRTHWPLLALALWLVALAGWRPIALPDEGRYGGVAYEMLSDGQWLTPTLFGLPYFHKPPLMYWIDRLALQALGPHALALRAAPMLGAWVMGLALWIEARAQFGAAQARQALAVLAVLPLFYLGGQYANHDMLVAGWISLAVVAARRALTGPAHSRRWLALAWASMGFAVLSKGLIGVVVPGLIVLPWLAVTRRWRALAFALHPLGWGLFLVVTLPWGWAMQAQHPAFFDYFIVEQHFRRYTQTYFNNAQPWWFFLAVLPLGTGPLVWRLPQALRQRGFELWWIAVVVAFFSFPRSKLVGYVLPTLVPWALVLFHAWRGHARVRPVLMASAVLCVALVQAITTWGKPDHADLAQALRAHWQDGDRVVVTGEPFFDLRLLAQLRDPPAVLADWAQLSAGMVDNWQRELADAARFAPDHGARVLWTPEQLQQQRCQPGRLWLVAPPADALPDTARDARPVFAGRRATLFELPRPTACP